MSKVSDMLGETITKVEGAEKDSESVVFTMADGTRHEMYHDQDCCECVLVEDVIGGPSDLIGHPLTMAEEVSSDEAEIPDKTKRYVDDSFTWTFYKLATIKGFVTIRWLGTSNGYYSESVNFRTLKSRAEGEK